MAKKSNIGVEPPKMVDTPSIQAIYNSTIDYMSDDAKAVLPKATSNTKMNDIASVMGSYNNLPNEFINTLINRIGKTIISSKTYHNPLSMFKKGRLELGAFVQEIFVRMTESYIFDIDDTTSPYATNKPDVEVAYHVLNLNLQYETTVNETMINRAFTSWTDLGNLVSGIIAQITTSAMYDEFMIMKYVMARAILNGDVKGVVVPNISSVTSNEVITKIKTVSNYFEFMSKDYNEYGVENSCQLDDQFLIMTGEAEAILSVNSLAMAFNLDKMEYLGKQVRIDGFHIIDFARLSALVTEGVITPFTNDEIVLLKQVSAILLDRDWYQIYEKEPMMTSIFNPAKLNTNYFYTIQQVVSHSPFNNACAFIPSNGVVTTLKVLPETMTITGIQGMQFSLGTEFTGTGLYSKRVLWTSSNTNSVVVDKNGVCTVVSSTIKGVVTITATSLQDSTKTGTCVVTVQ